MGGIGGNRIVLLLSVVVVVVVVVLVLVLVLVVAAAVYDKLFGIYSKIKSVVVSRCIIFIEIFVQGNSCRTSLGAVLCCDFTDDPSV